MATPSPPGGLSPAQVAFWHANGYLILPDELSASTISEMLTETHHLLTNFPLANHPMTKFTTGASRDPHVGDDYFLASGDKVRFFFDEDAVSPSGSLLVPQARAVNKIGHALHARSPPFYAATLTARNAAVARALGFRDPQVLQSMVICKQPRIGGAVPPHQDSTFLYTEPPSAVGFWYALEDCTMENGCLSFCAGSQKWAPVRQRLVRAEKGGTEMVPNEGPEFPAGVEARDKAEEVYEPAEVKAGTLVLIHGNTLHKSEKNLSDKSRFICMSLALCGSADAYRYVPRHRGRSQVRRAQLAAAARPGLLQAQLV
jgi:ectoine hydroxylase-related dioxygenase (phytanoyl-CoA dioxygenase family)